MHPAVQTDPVRAGHTVLGNVERQAIAFTQKLRSPVKRLRCHRPVIGSPRVSFRAFYADGTLIFSGTHRHTVVNIVTDIIELRGNDLPVLWGKERQILSVRLLNFFREAPQIDRIVPDSHIPEIFPKIPAGGSKHCLSCRFDVFLFVRYRIVYAAAGCHPDPNRLHGMFADRAHRVSVRFEHIRPGDEEGSCSLLDPRREFTGHITESCRALRLINRKEVPDPVGEMFRHKRGIVCKSTDNRRILPCAPLFQFIGKIPVKQRHIRLDARLQKSVNDVVVIGKAFLIHLSCPFGQDSRPAEGKTIGFDAEFLHNGNVFFVTVIGIAGNVSGMAFIDSSRFMRENIPDALSLSAFLCAALDLVRRCSCSPDKIFCKPHSQLPFYVFILSASSFQLIISCSSFTSCCSM